MTITERLAEDARRRRNKPCPPECCPRCYSAHCRMLLVGCCVCTGDIDLTWRGQKFSIDTTNQTNETNQ